jgi:hypothetical protein
MVNEKTILIRRGFLQEPIQASSNAQYCALEAFRLFSVRFNKPQLATEEHIQLLSQFFNKHVPRSFYNNPQDTAQYTSDELALEQFISYVMIEYHHGVDSNVDEHFDRIELFKKVLPDYKEGTEVVERMFNILDDKAVQLTLASIAVDLVVYTRPWNETEEQEFYFLYDNNFYGTTKLASKSNAIAMYQARGDIRFAQSLDQKDIVKMSIEEFGQNKKLSVPATRRDFYLKAINNCYVAPMTKKQAKYFNTLAKHVGLKTHVDNYKSPYRRATVLMKENKVVEAAQVLASSGSLLERHLVWILSRCDLDQAIKVLDLLKVNNPIVSMQFINALTDTTSGPRTFRYYTNKRIRTYTETDKEARYRKSILSPAMKEFIQNQMILKVKDFYVNKPSIGKVYINPLFAKIGIPYNTSASGTGLGVIPTGSRLPITEDYIRTFCHWQGVHDIDTALSFIHTNGQIHVLSWGTYATKPFGNSALYSGDDRGFNGAEYGDFKLSELKANGYKYGVFCLNGYGGTLNEGEIYCGYQHKKDLNTKAWQPNNIQVQIRVKGNSRAYMGFAIDFDTNEMVILNQMLESNNRVMAPADLESIKPYLDPKYLSFMNVAFIASARGEVVDNPEYADVIFDDTYQPVDNQSVIRPTDIEKIVKLLS